MMAGSLRFCPVCFRALLQRVAAIRRDLPGTPIGLVPRGVIGRTDPKFRWTAVIGASHYEIGIERVDDPYLVSQLSVFDQQYSLAIPIADDAEYRWRVRAAVGDVVGGWSAWYEFSIPDLSKILTELSISGPATVTEGASAHYTATASWDDGSGADVSFAVEWSEDSEFSDIDHSGALTTTDVEDRETVTITAEFEFGSTTMVDTFELIIFDRDQIGVFSDGFESGDMERWSNWTPG